MKLFLILIFASICAQAGESLQYFDNKIDYWEDQPKEQAKQPAEADSQDGKFPWKTYMDPKNKEFFKEGDYTPPEPFMEVARNPSDDNIKNWFDFMQKKNELQQRLQTKMQEYLAKNAAAAPSVQTAQKVTVSENKPIKANARVDPSRFHFRMYFESTCPHCRRMFSVLKRFKDEGFTVEALEVDSGQVPEDEKIVPIGKADPAELKQRGVKGVPFLLIADIKRQAVLPPVEGYHDYEEVLSLLQSASN
jgi:thiol-disulfide isomerase/thioredoxin